jgi:superfamily II DNA/RNA helicase
VQAVAAPGSGKTLGFLLPVLAALAAGGHGARTAPAGPLALLLVPARCAAAPARPDGRCSCTCGC